MVVPSRIQRGSYDQTSSRPVLCESRIGFMERNQGRGIPREFPMGNAGGRSERKGQGMPNFNAQILYSKNADMGIFVQIANHCYEGVDLDDMVRVCVYTHCLQ